MARSGVPIDDVPPAVVASLPGGRALKGPDIRTMPVDDTRRFGTKDAKLPAPPRKRRGPQEVVWRCWRCGRGTVPFEHECAHGRVCRYRYEDTVRGQKAAEIECADCDRAQR